MRPQTFERDIKNRFTYNPVTGKVFCVKSKQRPYTVGEEVGHVSCSPSAGNEGRKYLSLTTSFNGKVKRILVHRLAWLLLHGSWPDGEIDHIDGDGLNNKADNLRLCNRFENMQNTKKRAHSKNPYKGVYTITDGRTWYSRIRAYGERHYLGTFQTAELAHAAYCRKAEELHKQFARSK